MTYCYKCGNEIKDEFDFCSSCGTKKPDIDKISTKFCENCGTKIPSLSNFCISCGVSLKNNKTADTQTVETVIVDSSYNENSRPNPVESFKLLFLDMFNYKKRMGRADYWWGYLAGLIFLLININLLFVSLIYVDVYKNGIAGGLMTLLSLILIIFSVSFVLALLSARVRRLHDINLSGAFIFLELLPGIGSTVLFIMTLLPSKQIGNRYI